MSSLVNLICIKFTCRSVCKWTLLKILLLMDYHVCVCLHHLIQFFYLILSICRHPINYSFFLLFLLLPPDVWHQSAWTILIHLYKSTHHMLRERFKLRIWLFHHFSLSSLILSPVVHPVDHLRGWNGFYRIKSNLISVKLPTSTTHNYVQSVSCVRRKVSKWDLLFSF